MRNGVVDDEDSRQRNCWRCEWEAGRIAMWVNGYRMWLSLLHPCGGGEKEHGWKS